MPEQIIIYTDGGSRGNPGPSSAAYVIFDDKKNKLAARGVFLGNGTNNTAEYTAVIKALEQAEQIGAKIVQVFSDSELLVRQINGEYRVKSEQLRPLFQRTVELLNKFENWKVLHIRRNENKQADKLVNKALDLERDVEGESQAIAKKGKPLRLGVLISGGGRTLLNILECIRQGQLHAEVVQVISSRSTVAGVERARTAGLDVKIIRRKDYPDIDQFSSQLEAAMVKAKVDLVIQAGWLCLWKIPSRYENRVMNIHPALLPSFGGKGMYGRHVHEAVLKAGCKVSGCTVHFCTNAYDKGKIIVQRSCPVKEDDTTGTLAARVFEQENIAYPEAIRLFAEGRVNIK